MSQPDPSLLPEKENTGTEPGAAPTRPGQGAGTAAGHPPDHSPDQTRVPPLVTPESPPGHPRVTLRPRPGHPPGPVSPGYSSGHGAKQANNNLLLPPGLGHGHRPGAPHGCTSPPGPGPAAALQRSPALSHLLLPPPSPQCRCQPLSRRAVAGPRARGEGRWAQTPPASARGRGRAGPRPGRGPLASDWRKKPPEPLGARAASALRIGWRGPANGSARCWGVRRRECGRAAPGRERDSAPARLGPSSVLAGTGSASTDIPPRLPSACL